MERTFGSSTLVSRGAFGSSPETGTPHRGRASSDSSETRQMGTALGSSKEVSRGAFGSASETGTLQGERRGFLRVMEASDATDSGPR